MNTKLDLFRIFSVVAGEKSFSKAATKLYMTQPAISQFIAQLEKELKVMLFYRTRKGVTLTSQGQLLYEHVQNALSILEKGIQVVTEQQKLLDGKLTIGVGDTISRYFLITYLAKFREQYPNIKLKVINGTTQKVCQLLLQKEIDLGICNTPIIHKDISTKPYMNVQDIFVCSPKLTHLLNKEIPLKQLAEESLIMLDRDSSSRRIIEQHFQYNGIQIKPDFELGNHDLLIDFAKKGLGVAAVIKEFSEEPLNKGEIVELIVDSPLKAREISICTLNNITLTKATKHFLSIIQKEEV